MAHLNSRGKLQLIKDKRHKISTADGPPGNKCAPVVQNAYLQS